MRTSLSFVSSLIVVSLFLIIRLYYLAINNYDLFPNEAEYWFWSKDINYFSPYPISGLMLNLFTSICGDSEFCIRLPYPILASLTSIIIYFISSELYKNKKTAFYSCLFFTTMPAIFIAPNFYLTDYLSIFLFSLAILFFLKSVKQNNIICWIFAGFFLGIAMLSKYESSVFFLCIIVFFVGAKEKRYLLKKKGLWIVIAIALMAFLPNLYWKILNDFISFESIQNSFNLILSQFILFSLISFITLIYILIILFSKKEITFQENFLLSFTLPILMVGIALNSVIYSYICACILITSYLINKKKKYFLLALVIINILSSALVINAKNLYFARFQTYSTGLFDLVNIPDITTNQWEDFTNSVLLIHNSYPDANIIAGSTDIYYELIYYAKSLNGRVVKWNSDNATDLVQITDKSESSDFLYVTKMADTSNIKRYFDNIERIGNIALEQDYYIYHIR